MDDALLDDVLARLDNQPLPDECSNLLLAALEGDENLATALNAPHPPPYVRPEPEHESAEPVGAYLSELTVEAFRGIGPPATLKLQPGPGLTLVVGRNGSGKSSFAEALEVLLTGDLMRLIKRPAVARDGWRSKHSASAPRVTAEFLVEGSGTTEVGRSWDQAETDMRRSSSWAQPKGSKREPITALGWNADLVAYRPFLSYAEIESFFGTPSELHDLLAPVLGLQDLTEASERLRRAAKDRDDALTVAKRRLEELRTQLTPLAEQDERASACLLVLAGSNPVKWDIAAAQATATGSGGQQDDGQLALLRRLAQLDPPSAAEIEAACSALRSAATGLTEIQGTSAAQASELAALLDAALSHHEAHRTLDCPVCGTPGVLTAAWQADTERHRDRLREQAAEAEAAVATARDAVARAIASIRQIPQVVSAGPDHGAGLDLAPARSAWQSWVSLPPGAATSQGPFTGQALIMLADHLEAAYPALDDAVATLRTAAEQELAARDDLWAPIASEVARWCADAESARAGSKLSAPLKQARKWLTESIEVFRDQRLYPLAERSRGVWADLRQESSVSIGAFRLTGSNTRRALELDVSIDGEPGAALGVMSQGEINALALSVFLPRATMPESPFRFLVIDDPVQAMDPAKVDGLAKVLHKVAATRQVIVFTHDNRLAAAVKDLAIPATILEVTRQPKSVVAIRDCLGAPEQALKDAGALNVDENVPEAVARQVIPGLCRTAVEATFVEAYWRQQLRAGRTRAEIEATIAGTKPKLVNFAALALFGDPHEGQQVFPELDRHWAKRFADTVKELNRGSHEGSSVNLDYLIGDSRALIKQIEERLK